MRFKKKIEWSVADRPFSFVSDNETGSLLTPEGEVLEMNTTEWAALREALGQFSLPSVPKEKAFRPLAGATNNGKPWSQELDEKLAELWKAEKNIDDIAGQFGRTPGAIAARLAKLGLVSDRYLAALMHRTKNGSAVNGTDDGASGEES